MYKYFIYCIHSGIDIVSFNGRINQDRDSEYSLVCAVFSIHSLHINSSPQLCLCKSPCCYTLLHIHVYIIS